MSSEGIPSSKRQRLDSLAIETSLSLTPRSNTLSCLTSSGHDRVLHNGIKNAWSSQEGCDFIAIVEFSMAENIFSSEFKGQPVRCVAGTQFAIIKFHKLIGSIMSPVLASIFEAYKRRQSRNIRSNTAIRNKSQDVSRGALDIPDGVDFSIPENVKVVDALDTACIFRLKKEYVEGAAFCRLVQYMYSGSISLSESNISETLRAANFLKIRNAIEICAEYLLNRLQPCNALSIYALGTTFQCGKLEESADEYVNDHFLQITQKSEWLEMPDDAVQKLVSRDELRCNTEADVVSAIFSWVCHKHVGVLEECTDATSPTTSLSPIAVQARYDSLKRMLNEPLCVRFIHLSEKELEELGKVAERVSPKLLELWTAAAQPELERRKQQLVDDLQVSSRLRRYKISRGIRVVFTEPLHSLHGHCGYVYAVTEFNCMIISGSRDQTIRVWEYCNGMPMQTKVLEGHSERVFGLVSLSNGFLASCSFDQTVRIWNSQLICDAVLEGHDGWVVGVCEVANRLVSSSADTTLKVWNMKTWQCEYTLSGHTDHVYGCCLFRTPAGEELLVSGSQDTTLRIWIPQKEWKHACTLFGHKGPIRSIKQCGKILTSASADHTIGLWTWVEPGSRPDHQASYFENAGFLKGHCDVVETLVSVPYPDHEPLLASGGRDNMVNIWNLQSRTCIITLSSHMNWVKSLSILSHGALASGSADGTVKIWDTKAVLASCLL